MEKIGVKALSNKNWLVIFAGDGITTQEQAENLVQWVSYHGFTIKQVEGVYKGQKEISFVASYSFTKHPLFAYLTQGQETVLILKEEGENNTRKAFLAVPSALDNPWFIGYWQSVEREPIGLDYTYCPLNKAYYTIKQA